MSDDKPKPYSIMQSDGVEEVLSVGHKQTLSRPKCGRCGDPLRVDAANGIWFVWMCTRCGAPKVDDKPERKGFEFL